METRNPAAASERGAILVHVALAILALIAFTTFVVDYGTLWLSRRQAQNAADAGALAGAIAFAYDDPIDKSDTGLGKQNAYVMTQKNLIYGAPPNVNVTTDVTFPPCPDGTDACIRVDVYRNQARGNALPVFFGTLVGLTDQGIRATATAQILAGNASNCLKPWGVPDKWDEYYPTKAPWDPSLTYEGDKGDIYIAPSKSGGPGTGFTLAADLGTELVLKPGNPTDAISPGFFFPVVLDETCKGGDCYRDAISGCANVTWGIGDEIEVEPGNMIGPTKQGVDDLIAKDSGAKWDSGAKEVIESCIDPGFGPCPGGFTGSFSPRVVPLPVFDIGLFEGNGRTTVRIVNILGFFVDKMVGNDVHGFLMSEPSIYVSGKGEVPIDSAFSKVILLVR